MRVIGSFYFDSTSSFEKETARVKAQLTSVAGREEQLVELVDFVMAGGMLSKAVIRPVSPSEGWEDFSFNLDLDTVADAATILRNIEDVISKSRVGKAEIAAVPRENPAISASDKVNRVVEVIRNDSEKVFSRAVFIAIRDGHEHAALSIIRGVVPNVADQIGVELSAGDQERVAQSILERAREIQQKGEWEGTLKWLVERKRAG